MNVVKVLDPEIAVPGYEFDAADEAAVLAEVFEDGKWTAGTNQGPDGQPVGWGVARYGDVFYLWSGPYAPGGGTAEFQVDTYTMNDHLDEPDGAPCCLDPGCGGNPCTFPGYAANH